MKDPECHSKNFCDLIFLDNNKPLKILKQGLTCSEFHIWKMTLAVVQKVRKNGLRKTYLLTTN